jgi:hypothetical protein
MSLLVWLSVLAVAASLGVALWAWLAMRQVNDDLHAHANFSLMRLDLAAAPMARPPSNPPQGLA